MKTKNKTEMTIVPTQESDTYKRNRMLEVRFMVAKAVKNNDRVDLMDFEGTDIARSQIALQDLLTKEQEKHAKARGHIMDFISHENSMANTQRDLLFDNLVSNAQQFFIGQRLKVVMEECNRLSSALESETRKRQALQVLISE